jgi:hypothetical protein
MQLKSQGEGWGFTFGFSKVILVVFRAVLGGRKKPD